MNDSQGKESDSPLDFASIELEEKSFLLARRTALGTLNGFTDSEFSALCLSGGGVRSASFSLGFMRSLAGSGLLKQFDYLSTVSGGGFAGSFLTRLVYDCAVSGGYVKAEEELSARNAFDAHSGSSVHRPLSYLRDNISYLNPRFGLFSLDSLAGVGLYLRNLLLNWLVILPVLLGAIFTILLIFELARLARDLHLSVHPLINYSIPLIGIVLLGWSFAESLLQRREAMEAGATKTAFSKLLLTSGLPQFLAALLLAFSALLSLSAWQDTSSTVVSLAGALFAVLAFGHGQYVCGEVERRTTGLNAPRFFAVVVQGVVTSVAAFWMGKFLISLPESITYQSQLLLVLAPLVLAISHFLGETVFVALTSPSLRGELEREWLARSSAAQFRLPITWACSSLPIAIAPEFFDPQNFKGLLELFTDPAAIAATATTGLAGSVILYLHKAKDIWEIAKKQKVTFLEKAKWQMLLVALIVFTLGLIVALGYFGHVAGRSLSKSDSLQWAATNFVKPVLFTVLVLAGWLLISLTNNRTTFRFVIPAVLSLALLVATFPLLDVYINSEHSKLSIAYLLLATTCVLVWLVSDFFVESNKFSLHGIYRNRIIRTFLGAGNSARPKNLDFYNFFDADNIPMEEIGKVIKATTNSSSNHITPQVHILNCALNVPASKSLAVQERKALPFSISPFHVGSRMIGSTRPDESRVGSYRKSEEYAKTGNSRIGRYLRTLLQLDRLSARISLPSPELDDRPISLGTATAISGAAFNSNMGYHSSAALSVLMTAFNVRLGCWLGNTNEKGQTSHRLSGPTLSAAAIAIEALGLANDDRSFIHLSDGGHFDNLALYEMLLRRCLLIVVVDAGADPRRNLADLGISQRLAYLDAGARINFKPGDIDNIREQKSLFLVGSIDYGDNHKPGTIIYVKPRIFDGAPAAVISYAAVNKEFPHEPTVDQWFSESQFSAYFLLGECMGKELVQEMPRDPRLSSWTIKSKKQRRIDK